MYGSKRPSVRPEPHFRTDWAVRSMHCPVVEAIRWRKDCIALELTLAPVESDRQRKSSTVNFCAWEFVARSPRMLWWAV